MACLPDFDISAALPRRHILKTVFDEKAPLINPINQMPAFIPECFRNFPTTVSNRRFISFCLNQRIGKFIVSKRVTTENGFFSNNVYLQEMSFMVGKSNSLM